jgi:hypothetical protein
MRSVKEVKDLLERQSKSEKLIDTSLAGDVIKNKMIAKNLTKRHITAMSRELEQKYPDRYSELSPQTVVNICKPGYISKDRPGAGILYSVVEILWDGDIKQFHNDTKYLVHPDLFTTQLPEVDPINRVLYFEGEIPGKHRQNLERSPVKGADFLLRCSRSSEEGLAVEVTHGAVKPGKKEDLEGSLVVLLRDSGLEVALCSSKGKYRNASGNFAHKGDVYGKIIWSYTDYRGSR